jgi:hypothetical protein
MAAPRKIGENRRAPNFIRRGSFGLHLRPVWRVLTLPVIQAGAARPVRGRMGWDIVERRLGRAGGVKQREARQHEWDRKYGENWAVGYVIDGAFVLQDDAVEQVYQASYEAFLDAHPDVLDALVRTAKVLRNPHALATGGVDLQVPALHEALRRRGLGLAGDEVVDIGSWQGQASHALSVRLSPLHLPCAAAPGMTLEKFWQERKVLAVWREDA